MRKYSAVAVALAATLIPCLCHADTEAPRGLGQAGTWVAPCELLDRRVKGQALTEPDDAIAAALCQGAFEAIMAVNYSSPPYLPFCEQDSVRLIDYVDTFIAFMKANPSYATKKFGLAVLVSLGQIYPKSQCGG